jgi:hypothetical protein
MREYLPITGLDAQFGLGKMRFTEVCGGIGVIQKEEGAIKERGPRRALSCKQIVHCDLISMDICNNRFKFLWNVGLNMYFHMYI